MNITALVENTSAVEGIGAEHGLSLYIETAEHTVLFDMGQTELFANNASKLGVDLSAVDIAVLSHGHYDHGGGLARFLKDNTTAPVYCHCLAFEPHFNGERYIGLEPSLAHNERLVFTEDVCKIAQGMTLYSCNGRTKYRDIGSFGLNRLTDGQLCADDFHHEQYLLIEENGKRVLVSGCSHKGILNVAYWFAPDVLVGGFHFSKFPLDDTLKQYAEYLGGFDTDYYTCHCTGAEQYAFMKHHIKRLHYVSAGQTIAI